MGEIEIINIGIHPRKQTTDKMQIENKYIGYFLLLIFVFLIITWLGSYSYLVVHTSFLLNGVLICYVYYQKRHKK